SERRGPADPVCRRRLPRRAGLRADFRAAVRRAAVDPTMTPDASRARRLVAAAAAAGLVLRLAFALGYWVEKPLTHDEREYLALARGLATGRGVSYDPAFESGTAPRYGRAPGYPVFLAAIGAGGRDYAHSPARVKIAQAIVGAVGVWIVGLIAWR